MTNKSSTIGIFFLTLVCSVLCSRKTSAEDAPTIVPTRLDFDAAQAPQICNDDITFRALLGNWVKAPILSLDADRLLTVRIRRSPTGGKLADVLLLDAAGAELAQDHKKFASKTECYKVLYETARVAAKLMGAFEKPPVPEPVTCPTCPACATCPAPVSCPLPSVSRILPSPGPTSPPALRSFSTRRAFFGAGVFFGTGAISDAAIGPHVSLGFVPSRHSPRIQIEIDGAWTSQTLLQSNAPEPLRVHAVPLYGALCYSRYVFRICSGLTSTFYQAERKDLAPGNDDLRMTLAAHLRMGTEFEIAAPFSIRFDAYAMLRFWERSYGANLAALDELSPFGAGAVAMGVWSFE